jgi:hypothetical protein
LVQNQKWMVMHLLPCYWFLSPQTQRMVVHEIDLVGKTISSFNKAQQNMHNVAVCSPKPCMCCKNTRTFKITLEDKTKQDDWNKHTSEAAVIPYKYIRMIWVHCNKMESIPGGKSIVDLLSQLWEYGRQCRNSSWLSRLAWCKRLRFSLQYGDIIWPQTILVSNLPCCFI